MSKPPEEATVQPQPRPSLRNPSLLRLLPPRPFLPVSIINTKSSVGIWALMLKWDRFVPTSVDEVRDNFSIVEKPGIGQEHGSDPKSRPLRGSFSRSALPFSWSHYGNQCPWHCRDPATATLAEMSSCPLTCVTGSCRESNGVGRCPVMGPYCHALSTSGGEL